MSQTIADKIRKIIALAESTTHPDEADAFMAKAQDLMMSHGMSLLDIGRLDADDPVGTDRDVTTANTSAAWRVQVGGALAKYYGCEMITGKSGTMTMMHLVGRESARVTFSLMVEYVFRQVRSQAHIAHKAGVYGNHKLAMTAVGNALALRIWKLVRDQRANTTSGIGKGMNALVPVDMIDLEKRRAFPSLRTRPARPLKTDSAAMAAADKISLRHQTTAAGANRMIAG